VNEPTIRHWLKSLIKPVTEADKSPDEQIARASRVIVDAFNMFETQLRNIEESLAAIRAENARVLKRVKRRARK
jgi:hypothetical protein